MQILLFSVSKGHNSKKCNPELRFLCSACRLMLVNIPVKFQCDILNGFRVTEQTRFVTDRRPGQKQYVSGGDIILFNFLTMN